MPTTAQVAAVKRNWNKLQTTYLRKLNDLADDPNFGAKVIELNEIFLRIEKALFTYLDMVCKIPRPAATVSNAVVSTLIKELSLLRTFSMTSIAASTELVAVMTAALTANSLAIQNALKNMR